jgi:hypothetical protein
MTPTGRFLGTALAAALLLAGCGGGGDDPPAAASPLEAVPAQAAQSATGLARYLEALAARNGDAEGLEPVSLEGYVPFQPEDSEPEPVG